MEEKEVVKSTALQTVFLMGLNNFEYTDFDKVLLCVNASLANVSGMPDIVIPMEGYTSFLRDVCLEFGAEFNMSAVQNYQAEDFKEYVLCVNKLLSIENLTWDDCITKLTTMLKNKECPIGVVRAIKGVYLRLSESCISVSEYLLWFKDFLYTPVFDVPNLCIEKSVLKKTYEHLDDFTPTSLKDELAYAMLFIKGVEIAQLFGNIKGNATVDIRDIVSRVMRSKYVLE